MIQVGGKFFKEKFSTHLYHLIYRITTGNGLGRDNCIFTTPLTPL